MISKIKLLIKKIIFYENVKSITRIRKVKNKTKIFCVGFNKTGTTSINEVLTKLGIIMAPQRPAELLIDDWISSNYKNILNFCSQYQGFQDIPFSSPNTYKYLDKAFPNSKFILSIRDSPEQWYFSLTKFHSKLFGKEGETPTKRDLEKANYVYKGWMWKVFNSKYNPSENDIYNKTALINKYNKHNKEIKDYFSEKEDQLLVLNVAETNSYQKLCTFLGITSNSEYFPHLNKT